MDEFKCPKCWSKNIRFFAPVSFEFVDDARDMIRPVDQGNYWHIEAFSSDLETSCQDCDFDGDLVVFIFAEDDERQIGELL